MAKLLGSERLDGVAEELKAFASAAARTLDFDVRVTSGRRSDAEQRALYELGRSKPGKIVTNAATAWDSAHGTGLAIDLAPIIDGKIPPDVAHPAWQALGALGEAMGLTWGGRWEFVDGYHFEVKDWRKRRGAAPAIASSSPPQPPGGTGVLAVVLVLTVGGILWLS